MRTDVRSIDTRVRKRRRTVLGPLPRARTEVFAPRKGDAVVADNGYLGRVDDVILTEASTLAFIVVKVGPMWRGRWPIVARDLLKSVSRQQHLVRVLGDRSTLARLSEALPIVI